MVSDSPYIVDLRKRSMCSAPHRALYQEQYINVLFILDQWFSNESTGWSQIKGFWESQYRVSRIFIAAYQVGLLLPVYGLYCTTVAITYTPFCGKGHSCCTTELVEGFIWSQQAYEGKLHLLDCPRGTFNGN